MAMACHLFSDACWALYGQAAVPTGTPRTYGTALGSVQTCTAQGFFNQIALTVWMYYACLSLYSYVAVYNHFDVTKYRWVARYIHVGAHAYPVATALYVLSVEGFNYSGDVGCYVSSIPVGCGDDAGVVCERGPQNISVVSWIVSGIPVLFFLLFPTVIMIALYCHLRNTKPKRKRNEEPGTPSSPSSSLSSSAAAVPHQSSPSEGKVSESVPHQPTIAASTAARQGGIYLFVVYWSYIFAIVNQLIRVYGVSSENNTAAFAISMLSNINLALQGFWIFLIYRWFTAANSRKVRNRQIVTSSSKGSTSLSSHTTTKNNNNNKSQKCWLKVKRLTRSTLNESSAFQHPSDEAGAAADDDDNNNDDDDGVDKRITAASFNIFDGTNAGGSFAAFVHSDDGDDEEENAGYNGRGGYGAGEDARDSKYWSTIQDYV